MTSRGRTAPLSQPASVLKPSRAQTRPPQSQAKQISRQPEQNRSDQRQRADSRQQTRASRRQDSRTSRRNDTRVGTRANRRDDTRASGRTFETRGTAKTGGKKSLYDDDRDRKSGAGGEKLKTTDVWNKFLDDKKDVVRAPTAESRDSYVTGESDDVTYTDDSDDYTEDSEESRDEEEEGGDDVSDDARTIYSNYYLDHEYYEPEGPPEPRVEILDGKTYEACSCFPNRGDKTKGSMLYDKVKCKHTGLVGHTQPGVFKFNPYWNENMEIPRKLRKRDMSYPKTTYLFGYPKPRFELVSDSEGETEDGYHSDHSRNRERSRGQTRRDSRGSEGSYTDTENDDDDFEEDFYTGESDDDDDDDDEDQDFVPFQLPQIGFPKTPSLPRSSQSSMSFRSQFSSEYSDVPDSLPDVPKSRQLTTARTADSGRQATTVTRRSTRTRHDTRKPGPRTAKTSKSRRTNARYSDDDDDDVTEYTRSRRRAASRQSLLKGPEISNTRTFQGKFYDPVTKQIMLYDIKKESEKRLPTGLIEPLYKPMITQQTAQMKLDPQVQQQKPEAGFKPGSQTNQPSQPSVGIKAAILGNVFIHSMLKSIKKTDKEG